MNSKTRIIKFILNNEGQGLSETVIVVLVVIMLVMVTVQLGIIFTVKLAANTAAWQASRAVRISANGEEARFEDNNTSQEDVRNSVLEVLNSIGLTQNIDAKLFYYNTQNTKGYDENDPVEDEIDVDRDVWVIVTCQAKILMPFTRMILGDGAPRITALPYKTIKATCLVHTPHKGINNP